MKNQELYDIWGGLSTTGAGLIVPAGQAYTGAKMAGLTGKALLGTVGKSLVKELSYDIAEDVIGSGTSSFMFDLTGNANLSRLAGLSAGMMTSSKSSKVKGLNSVDGAGSSSVKGLNHADNLTSTSKKLNFEF